MLSVFTVAVLLVILPWAGYSQCSTTGYWNSWASSAGPCGGEAAIAPTCGSKTISVPSTGYTYTSMIGGRNYTFSAAGGSGWTTPYVTIWQSTNSGGSWSYVGGAANSYTFTTGTTAGSNTPATSGSSWYYLVIVYNGNSCTPSWPGTSAVLTYQENSTSAPSSPAAGTAGSGVWNVYNYENSGSNAQGLALSTTTYKGYYSYNAGTTPTYATGNSWNTDCAGSYTSGYSGCNLNNNNHIVQSVQTGFTTHMWQIDPTDHDDDAEVFINPSAYDSQDGVGAAPVWYHTGSCCDAHTNLTGQNTTSNAGGAVFGIGEPVILNSSDVVDMRHADGCGGSHQGLAFTDVTNSSPRSNISATASVTGCTSSGSVSVSLSGGLTNVKTIKITQMMAACMNIAEVQAIDLFNGTNWAASSNGGSASASTIYNSSYPASNANNGNTTDLFHSGCNQYDWWQVALPASENLKSIVIYNRSDCCQSREAELKVECFDASSNLLYCKIINASASGATTIPLITGSWSNGATTQSISGLAAGTYTYSYSDALGRSASTSATISVPGLADGTFGTNQWNVFGYNSTTIGTNYYGYYQMSTATLNFDTRLGVANSNTWSWNQSTQGPSNASGYVGCAFGNTNISYRFMRRGFPCGYYTIYYGNDDGAVLKIDGNTVSSPGCCTPGGSAALSANFGSFYLGPNSTIEFDVSQGGGDTYAALQFNSAGSLSITSSAGPYCVGATDALTSSYAVPTGGTAASWTVTSGGSYASISGTTFTTGPNNSNATQTVGIQVSEEGCTATQSINVYPSPSIADGTFGTNQWNVFGYNSTNYTNYYGDYQMSTATLNFDTRLGVANSNTWSWNQSSQGPSNASGYVGCPFGTTNISYRFMRKGFPCGYYNILYGNDDGAVLYVDGTSVATPACCTPGGSAALSATIWSGFLGPNSTLEYRVTQGGGDTYGALQLNSAGSLSVTSSAGPYCVGATAILTSNYAVPTGGTAASWTVTSGGSYGSISGTTFTSGPNSSGSNQTVGIQVSEEGCTATQNITVYNGLSATLTGGSSPICYNTAPTTFTATGSGGTGAYTYLWYKNAASTGVTTSTYAPGNLTATSTIYCAVTSGSCGTVSSNSYTVTVYGNLLPTLSGGSSPICYNTTPATFTATGNGGTGSYTYLWYINSSPTGVTTSTYSPGNLTATSTVYCAVTSGSCGTVNTSTYTVTVYGNLIAGISGGASPICYNTAPGTFAAIASGGSGTYTYQWYNSSGLVSGATASSYAPGNLTASNSFYCSVNSAGCGAVNTSTTSITVYANLTASISGGSSPICYNTTPTSFTASGSGGTGSYTYLWYLNGSSSGTTTSTYSPGNFTGTSTVYCAITSGSCGTANSSGYTVTVDANLTASQSGGSSPICYNTAPGTITATGSGGTGSYTYLWYLNATSTGITTNTYAPGNLTATSTIYCAVTSGGCGTANTTGTTITVYPNLTAAITGGTTPICYNTSPGTFTATGSGGNGTYTYQWYNASGSVSGATASTYTAPSLTGSNSYYCSVTSGGSCGTVSTGTTSITVEPAVSSYGTVAASGGLTQTVCMNVPPNSGNPFTVSGAAGSSGTFTYQWYYQNGLIAAPSGSSTTGWTACGASQGSGYNTSSFTAAGPSANITYACLVTPASPVCSPGQWATNDVQVTVLTSGPTESSSGGGSVCIGGSVTLSSSLSVVIPATYQWYSSTSIGFTSPVTITGATSTTYAPPTSTSGTLYYEVIATFSGSGCSPATSNTQTVVVYTTPTASISGGSSPICYHTSPGTFTATGSGGSGSYTYQWYNSSGSISAATASTYSPGLLNASNSYYCSVTDAAGCGSATTSTTSITVDANLGATITGGTTPICYNTSPGTFTATASGGTGSYTYQWYNGSGSISGATASTYSPGNITASNSFFCAVTSGTCGTVNTSIVNITVHANLTVSATGGASPVCYNTSPGTFTLSASGGSGGYTYQWYNSSGSITGATASTYAPGNLTASDSYSCSVTSGTCGTVGSNTISITVDANLAASISGGTSPVCYNTAPGTFTATGTGGTSSYTYQWYNGAGSVSGATAITYAPGNITTGDSYSCSVTSGSCGTVGTNTISIAVDANLTAVISGGTSPICYNTDPGIFPATGGGGTGSYTYQWYNGAGSVGGATASTYAPGNLTVSNSYHCAITSGSCGTVNTSTTAITVYNNLTASVTGGTTPICNNTAPGTLTVTGSGGTGSYIYQWYNGAGAIGGATASTYAPGNLTGSDSYTCTVTSGSCSPVSSNTVSITVDAVLTNGTIGASQTICYGTAPAAFTSIASPGGGTGSYTYQWQSSPDNVTWTNITGATGTTYTAGALTSLTYYRRAETSGSCGTVYTAAITITMSVNLTGTTSTVSTNPVCITSSGGGTNVQIANSIGGVNYQLQTSTGSNVGTAVSGTGGTINLPTGNITATTNYQVQATLVSMGCTYTTPANISVVAVNPDIAFGTQIASNHFTFGTIASPTLPTNWTGPNNGNGDHWILNTTNPASSGSYSYYNNSGGTSSASTGAYIETPTGTTSNTPVVDLLTAGINTTGYSNISIQWAAQKTANYTGTVSLYCSTDGTTWTPVPFTDVPANLSGSPWALVNNTVQVKLPDAASNQAALQLKWSANPATDGSYYSMNDIGIYGLGKIINCASTSISVPYLNTSCSAGAYSLTADGTNPWPSSPAFSYVSNVSFSGSPIVISVPATTAAGTYNLDITVNDGAGHTSGSIVFPVTTDPAIIATTGLDNCSCNYTTSSGMGSAFGNIVTVYAAGGAGSGYYFNSAGSVDTLLSTIDAGGTSYAGSTARSGTKGVFWSKADGATHTYTISDGYCSTTATKVTQSTIPTSIPFSSATNHPTGLPGAGGGNNLSGSFNNSGAADPNISNVNGSALICHHTPDFGNNWVVYHVNNINSSGVPLTGDSTNNKAVVEINSNGVNLDSVQVSVYRDANLPVIPNASTAACSGYPEYGMERHFMIKSTKSTGANSFGSPVGVRLYFTDAEFQDLKYWTMYTATNATGASASCAYGDTVTNLNSIYVTKYTGTNEDGDYTNNSASGLYRLFGKNATNSGNGPLSAIDGGQATLATGGATNLHYVQMNVTEFSEFWLGGSQSIEALPVQMIYLEAEALNNDSIQVRWGTETEINNREFDVERSTDGNTWSQIDVVPGHGNSTTEQTYVYNDLNVVPGINYYYRLKQVDNNGVYEYTGIVQARITGQGAFAVMNFVPNPTLGNTQLTVVTTKSQSITVDFYDMLGQKVLSTNQQLMAGDNKIGFDLKRFAAGTYSVVVTSENQLYTKKVVVTK